MQQTRTHKPTTHRLRTPRPPISMVKTSGSGSFTRQIFVLGRHWPRFLGSRYFLGIAGDPTKEMCGGGGSERVGKTELSASKKGSPKYDLCASVCGCQSLMPQRFAKFLLHVRPRSTHPPGAHQGTCPVGCQTGMNMRTHVRCCRSIC